MKNVIEYYLSDLIFVNTVLCTSQMLKNKLHRIYCANDRDIYFILGVFWLFFFRKVCNLNSFSAKSNLWESFTSALFKKVVHDCSHFSSSNFDMSLTKGSLPVQLARSLISSVAVVVVLIIPAMPI